MIDIFIKSFNRPFYLDRCLSTIYKYVSGDFNIKVLDDGTPEKYLNKLQEKFPLIIIKKSETYFEKSRSIAENLMSGADINGFHIPVQLWIDSVKNASEYLIVIEDDVWFLNKINVDELYNEAKKFDINLIKLGWLGNKKDDSLTNNFSISNQLEGVQPKSLFLANKLIMEAFFYNSYKFFSVLYKLGKVDNLTKNKYWALNSILMGMYKKEYWLEIWKGMDGKVDEQRQLINASVYYKKHQKNKNFIARLKTEAMKTTFQSSATNSYHKYGYDFDVNKFNHIINEAWHKDEFDPLENFPNDFSLNYFEEFITNEISVEEFRKWVNQFKEQYRNLGADVD